mmetsp:Transcript_1813/g.2418  ORF Transcript_1813/g.2418 Transcript_1813/m.2418 type:complete len:126 (-) Transcript_1813:2673-3050(-)
MPSVVLDASSFYAKLDKIAKAWSKAPHVPDAMAVVMSKVSEDPQRINTVDFFIWLLGYEFSDTLLVVSPHQAVFAVSPKKAALLEAMEKPPGYSGPGLKVIVKDQDFSPANFLRDTVNGSKVAIF